MPDTNNGHIKMPAIEPIRRVVANGAQSVFDYPFPIFASEDLAVYFDGARQYAGFDITDAGQTVGGTVEFDTPPVNGVVVTLERLLPLERITDFLEGGDFSAHAINNELDYLTASIQQVSRLMAGNLRYSDHEMPSVTQMPERNLRANKALGFDGNGDPIALEVGAAVNAPDFTALGSGAAVRSSRDKMGDVISVKDFGAKGDGLTDDTLAFQQALSAYDSVYVPEGRFLISGTITLGHRQTLIGAGQTAVILCQDKSFNAIEVVSDYGQIANLRIEGGNIGIKLYGRDRPVVQVAVSDVVLQRQNIGVQLDGYNDTNKPTYWNNFTRVLVEQPAIHGFHLTRSGAGDTPNANKFIACRAYSLSAPMSGAGFYIEAGQFNNAFVDCEANVDGTAQGCFIVGAQCNKTLFINPYAESFNQVPNIKLEAGSIETSIFNLLSVSDGSAIWDLSGGEYTAYNAGFPYKNRLQKTTVTDINATLQRYDTEYIDASGSVTLDTSHSVHLVSSFGGALSVNLPKASEAVGAMMVIKKIDSSKNVITVVEENGAGPDNRNYYLGSENDYMQVMSNGAEWFVISSNRSAGNTRFYDGSGLYDIDMAVDTYLLSSFGGVLEARLPPANAPEAVGRTITIKKTDPSSNLINVSELGGAGPDGYTQPLNAQYKALTIVSDGGAWHILSKF